MKIPERYYVSSAGYIVDGLDYGTVPLANRPRMKDQEAWLERGQRLCARLNEANQAAYERVLAEFADDLEPRNMGGAQ